MTLDARSLLLVMPRAPADQAGALADVLGRGLSLAECHTVTRAAAFLGQVAWETAELRRFIEAADGTAYEHRRDLGNTEPGDGPRFKGRGAFQLTGRSNYTRYGQRIGLDLVAQPGLAADPDVAMRIAAAYWLDHGINAHVDDLDLRAVTAAINGAATDDYPSFHLRRLVYYRRALEVLGLTAPISEV